MNKKRKTTISSNMSSKKTIDFRSLDVELKGSILQVIHHIQSSLVEPGLIWDMSLGPLRDIKSGIDEFVIERYDNRIYFRTVESGKSSLKV